MKMSLKEKKRKLKPGIKLNHNIQYIIMYIHLFYVYMNIPYP